MENNIFIKDAEETIRKLLPSICRLKIQTHNDFVRLAFSESEDFVVAVLAATGANIKLEISGVFEDGWENNKSIDSCTLFMILQNGCVDIRFVFFIYEVLRIKSKDGKLLENETLALRRKFKEHEIRIENM